MRPNTDKNSSWSEDDSLSPQITDSEPTPGEQERLSRRLREARDYLGLSQEFVADELKVPRASISAMEAGKRKVGGLELKQLARLYKRPVSFFLEEEEEEAEDVSTLLRASRALDEEDRKQLVRFAQFLRQSGTPSQFNGSSEASIDD